MHHYIPASSDFFQALKALIRSKLDYGTPSVGSVFLAWSASVTIRRHSLYAKRDAPACLASVRSCAGVGFRANRNVVCRMR